LTDEKTRKKIITLFKEKKKLEKEVERLQNLLVQQMCPKGKKECEPAYCTFRLTDTCPFLDEWHKILEEAQVPKDTKYDIFINFIEKISKEEKVAE